MKDVRGVVPIIDSGEEDDQWVLVMPRADKSLREHLIGAKARLGTPETLLILIDIASALAELDGKVVHRDLKPENVLYLDGKWCLSDFGISRYAEATTAADTQKYSVSPPYAAPERRRAERATGAVDVYALDVMAFVHGHRLFSGPNIEDYREQHLHEDPPALDAGTSALKTIVKEALFKAPGARPSPANMLARLKRSQQQRSRDSVSSARLIWGKSPSRVKVSGWSRQPAPRPSSALTYFEVLPRCLTVYTVNCPLEAAPSAKKGLEKERGHHLTWYGAARVSADCQDTA